MKKRAKLILIAVLLIPIILFTIYFFINTLYCPFLENKVEQLMKNGIDCQNDSDCIEWSGGCPFGCGIPIAAKYVNELNINENSYRILCPRCLYKCAPPSAYGAKTVCENSKCAWEYPEQLYIQYIDSVGGSVQILKRSRYIEDVLGNYTIKSIIKNEDISVYVNGSERVECMFEDHTIFCTSPKIINCSTIEARYPNGYEIEDCSQK